MQNTTKTNPSDATKGPLAFIIASLVILCLSAVWLALNPGLLTNPKITPESSAWVYLAIYGFALSGYFGLIYRSAPLVFGAPLYSSPFVILHLVFHLVGIGILIPSAFFPDQQQSVMGQTFLACGAVTFIVNVSLTLRRQNGPDAAVAFIATSLLWLGIMILVGIPFAKTPLIAFFAGTDWSPAILALSLAGVVLNGVFGLAYRITSLRLHSETPSTNTPWFALVLVNSGAAWLFAATAFGPAPFILFCAVLYLAGVLVYVARFTVVLRAREEAALDWDSKILYTALWMVPVSLALFAFSVWTHSTQKDVSSFQLEASVLLAVLLGVCVPGLVALFYQTSSLLRGDARGADAPISVRLSSQILLAAFFNFAVGVLMLIPGAWLGIQQMLGLGTLFLVVGSLGFLINFLQTLRPVSPEVSTQESQPA